MEEREFTASGLGPVIDVRHADVFVCAKNVIVPLANVVVPLPSVIVPETDDVWEGFNVVWSRDEHVRTRYVSKSGTHEYESGTVAVVSEADEYVWVAHEHVFAGDDYVLEEDESVAAAAREFARHLRRQSTEVEKRLWRLLRDRRFQEFKFRRQYACGIYFLDFFCVEARLAVELDGGGHGFPDQRARGERRNQFLAEQGIEVLRFWNHKMRREVESVRFEIWYALMKRTGRDKEIAHLLPRPSTPHP